MDLTYREIGATRDPDRSPAGTHHVRLRRKVGSAADFAAASAFVPGYGMQRGTDPGCLRLPGLP